MPLDGDPEGAAHSLRRIILEQSKRAHVGHIGSALSIADIVAAVYFGAAEIDDVADPGRDRVVLSKGHASLAVYAALFLRGWIRLGVHPERVLDGVDFSTGSLGHGLSLAAGAALAARLQGSDRRVFAILSDAECDEGSTWEAALFAAHHQLGNLVVVVDDNGQQALGYTDDVLALRPLATRWRGFGWDAVDVDGHDIPELVVAMDRARLDTSCPHMLVARTVFGSGVSFMERQIKWHYLPMNDEEFAQAMEEVTGACAPHSSGR